MQRVLNSVEYSLSDVMNKIYLCTKTVLHRRGSVRHLHEQIKTEKKSRKTASWSNRERFLDEISIEKLSEGALPNFFPYSVPIQLIRNEYQTATWMSYLSF